MRATRASDETFSVPEDRILGLDNVPIDLPLATAGSRSLAAFIDYAVLGVASAAWLGGTMLVGTGMGLRGAWLIAIALLGFFALEYGYFAGCEIAMGGQTLGKRAIGLRVVTRSGARPGTSAFLIRNCVRTVDLLVGVLLMAIDPLGRRLGDRLAGTLVVRAARKAPFLLVLERVPRGWQGREIAIAEGFLRRASSLEATRADRLAQELLAAVAHSDPELAASRLAGEPALDALRRLLGVRESDR